MSGRFSGSWARRTGVKKWCQTPFSARCRAGIGCRGPKKVSDTIFRTPFFDASRRRSFDDLRDEIQAALDGRRVALVQLAHVLFRDDVLTQPLRAIERVRHRLDALGRHRRELPDHIDDAGQLGREVRALLRADLEPGELAKLVDVVTGERHAAIPSDRCLIRLYTSLADSPTRC